MNYLRSLVAVLLIGAAALVIAQTTEDKPLKFDAATLQTFVNDWKSVPATDPALQNAATDRLKLTYKNVPSGPSGAFESVYWLDLPSAPDLEFRVEVSLARAYDPKIKPKHPEWGDQEKYTLVPGTTFCWSLAKSSYFIIPLDKAQTNWGISIRVLARAVGADPKTPWHRAERGISFVSAGSGLSAGTKVPPRLLALGGFSYTLEI